MVRFDYVDGLRPDVDFVMEHGERVRGARGTRTQAVGRAVGPLRRRNLGSSTRSTHERPANRHRAQSTRTFRK
jgi:hypothetical protein